LPKVAISLVMYKYPEYTIKMLDSLISSDIANETIKFFVQDNSPGLSKPARSYIRGLPRAGQIYKAPNGENLGIVMSRIALMNEILKEDFDYMLEVHNDMIFCSHWFKKLLEADADDVGILCPYIYQTFDMSWTQQQMNEKCKQYIENKIDDNVVQTHPWLVKIPMVRKIGYYDSNYAPEQCEDDDFLCRAILGGWKSRSTKQSWVGHIGGVTRAGDQLALQRNFQYFYQKHGMSVFEFKKKYLTIHPIQL
jgi:GT2 family glycosyltransferase